jgi:sterol desaturase/sphingolipid hydroxylase (fatty acid hydroxylase superfamily)
MFMDFLAPTADRALALATPWPSIFVFDLGRYLLAAAIVTLALALLSPGVVARRRVRDRRPRLGQRWRELRQSVIAAAAFALVGLGVYHGAHGGTFRVYAEAAEYGWLYWLASIVLIIVAHDAYFYWTHRWMHAPDVFRRLHRTHHLSTTPTQWAAYSFSVGEAFMQAAFLPLFLLVVPTHESALFIWMAHQVVRNVAGHCGVELEPKAWLATWWGRWFTTTLHHDMHHEHGRCNYGLYFAWWDGWCGTEHPDYRKRLVELLSGIEQGKALRPQVTKV